MKVTRSFFRGEVSDNRSSELSLWFFVVRGEVGHPGAVEYHITIKFNKHRTIDVRGDDLDGKSASALVACLLLGYCCEWISSVETV